jgi:hypothetical protein
MVRIGVKTLTGIATIAVLLLVPATGQAQATLPVGETDGVRVVREHGAIVVVFTARADKLYKRVAGKRVVVSCTELLDDGSFTGTQTLRVSKHRRKIGTGDATKRLDYCRVWLPPRTTKRHGHRVHHSRELLVSIPLTQKGAVFLDEEFKALGLLGILFVASGVVEKQKLDGYPTYAQMLQQYPKLEGHLVALAIPTDTPPPDTIGYYSDGQQHVALAIVSGLGRRLFVEYAADEVLTTNVAGYIFGDLD